jgi:hypothetical protein
MISNIKADFIGTIAGLICVIHCAITPVVFIAKTCEITCCNNTPIWWQMIDFIFIIISFFAIHNVTKNHGSRIMFFAFWISWVSLLFSILNESIQLIDLTEWAANLPAFTIIILHIYNYVQCKTEDNCTNKTCKG